MRSVRDTAVHELIDEAAKAIRQRHAEAARKALATKRARLGQHTGGNIVPLDEILSLSDVIAITNMSRATIYRGQSAGTFPQSLQISPNRIGWRASTINSWMDGLRSSTATAA